MATVVAGPTRALEDRIHLLLASVCAVIAFTGFAGTYWLQLPGRTFVGSPLLHLHGLIFSLWTLFVVSQAALITYGRNSSHRAWGLAGIALASAMFFTGVAVAISGLQDRIADGHGEAARAFVIVPLSAIGLFAFFIVAAIVTRRRSDWHKRFMLVATVALLNAAIARFFFLAATGGGPGMRPGLGPPNPVEFALMPAMAANLIIVLAMLLDWRTRGRPHPAYLSGLGVMLAVQLMRGPFSRTGAWQGLADFLARFAG